MKVCKLNESVAKKLKLADVYLKSHSNEKRFLAWDCHRPVEAQTFLWNSYGCDVDSTKCKGFIAPPGKSKHNSGFAIDLTIAEKNGNPIVMPTPYDTFTTTAYVSSSSQWSELARSHWTLLNTAMSSVGCIVNPTEWWHYDCDELKK